MPVYRLGQLEKKKAVFIYVGKELYGPIFDAYRSGILYAWGVPNTPENIQKLQDSESFHDSRSTYYDPMLGDVREKISESVENTILVLNKEDVGF